MQIVELKRMIERMLPWRRVQSMRQTGRGGGWQAGSRKGGGRGWEEMRARKDSCNE
jgi:hypothetical protein